VSFWLAWAEGFGISIGLIVAFGPQNVYLLRQGLLGKYVLIACLVCFISDALLITAGVLGIGRILSEMDDWAPIIAIASSSFLVGYGILRIYSAINPKGLETGEIESRTIRGTIFSGLAFTWLNPHVYVDTLILIGGTSSRYVGDEMTGFTLGAITASFVFFFSLGYGAKFLSPILSTPKSWMIIDFTVAGIMFIIATLIMKPYV